MKELSKGAKKTKATKRPSKKTVKKPARKPGSRSRPKSKLRAESTPKKTRTTAQATRRIKKSSHKNNDRPSAGSTSKAKRTASSKAKTTAKRPQKAPRTKSTGKYKKTESKSSSRNRLKKLSAVLAVHPLRLLLVSAIIVSGAGFFYGQQMWTKGYAHALSLSSAKQAPTQITTAGPAQSSPDFSTYPTWAQNFTAYASGKPDSRYWNTFRGAAPNDNDEAQYYTDGPQNVRIKNGALSLIAVKQEAGGHQYTSARVDTDKKLSFLYGRIDVTAKLPQGVGTWPAVWFLPANTKYRDLSPPTDNLRYLNGGEIDMIEAVGFNPDMEYGVVHTRSDKTKHTGGIGSFNQVAVPGSHTDYNRYSLLWTPASITLEVNDTPFFTYDKLADSDYTTWSFDQPFYMIMNLALGGVWGGQDKQQFPGNGIDNSALPASMDIQSIYYYPYLGHK